MDDHHIQMVMANTSFYNGGIDGIFGLKSKAAMGQVEGDHKSDYKFSPNQSSLKRRKTAAAQTCLNVLGFEAGSIDGWEGVNTREATRAYLYQRTHGEVEVIERTPKSNAPSPARIPLQKDVGRVYGEPGNEIARRLVSIKLPFSLRLDWKLQTRVSKVLVHEECSTQLKKALIAVHDHYGEARMKQLGIDRFAGSYNHRRMRGSHRWSMHAYGCAVDFYAQPNGLRTRCPEALFCQSEYKDFLDIMQENEWLPAIRLWGADAMHFQRARLK